MKKILGCVCALALVAGCSEDETVDRTTTDASTETSATDTGTSSEVAVDSGATDTSSEAAVDTGATDAGEDTIAMDAGTEADCIDSDFSGYFDILDASRCVVGRYTVPVAGLSATWGRHGGPLSFAGGPEAVLARYELPMAATGSLTAKTQKLALTGLPSSIFWNSNAIDLPFFGWTGFAYTGAGSVGEVFFVDATGVRARYAMRGLFDMAGIAAVSGGGRLLYTGLSELSTTTPTTNRSALWAADSCGVASSAPRLLPAGDSSCKAPVEIGTWKPATGSSGPLALDRFENAFVVLNGEFGGMNELRGFERSTVARGATAAAGTMVVSSAEYFQNVAADGKTVFYRTDAWPAANLEVKAVGYSADPITKTLTMGSATVPIKLKKPAASVSLFVDSSQRLWIGLDAATSDAGPAGTVFFLLRSKKP